MSRRLALGILVFLAGSLEAQAEDSLTLRSSERTVRYALDCADATGRPARIPADYDGALAGAALDEPPRLLAVGRKEAPRGLEGQPGSIRFQFVVDTTGRIEPCTLSAEQVSDVRFVPAAARMLLRSTFTPGRAGGRKVRAVMTQGVSFL